ncbi:hypothetical protein ACA910_006303 [Epithemia clementina (nom. ined.)]
MSAPAAFPRSVTRSSGTSAIPSTSSGRVYPKSSCSSNISKGPSSARVHSSNDGSSQGRIPLYIQALYIQANSGGDTSAPCESNLPTQSQSSSKTKTSSKQQPQQELKETQLPRKGALTESSRTKSSKSASSETTPTTKKRSSTKSMEQKKFICKTFSLQDYFDDLLRQRGYHNAKTYDTLSTGYHRTPTELQLASYGPKILQLVKNNNVQGLHEVLTVAGLSPNPCNTFGESLVHMACRRGRAKLLRTMVQAGAALQICDDYGRTPLHDACWAAQPALDVVELLVIQCDRCMWFLKDCRGALPLSYVHKDHLQQWKTWLDDNMDRMFPPRNGAVTKTTSQQHQQHQQSSSRAPTNALLKAMPQYQDDETKAQTEMTAAKAFEPLSLELIQMVANGTLSPREARVMAEVAARGAEEETVADSIYDDDDDDDSSYYSSDDDEDYYDSEDGDDDDDDYYDSEDGDDDVDESYSELEESLVELLRGMAY